MARYEETLRKLAIREDRYIDAVLGDEHENMEASGLEPRVCALVRLGALIALDAAPPSYQSLIQEALAAGVSVEEIVGALVAVMPTTGVPRVVSAAPKLGLALGYDVEAALEAIDEGKDPLSGNHVAVAGRQPASGKEIWETRASPPAGAR